MRLLIDWHMPPVAAVAAVVLVCANVCAASDLQGPIEGLRFDLEHYPNGAVKIRMTAKTAEVPPSGPIKAAGVLVTFYEKDGKTVEGSLSANDCQFDRKTRIARSKSRIKLQKDGMTITGKGFEWNGKAETIKIRSKTRVVLRGLSKGNAAAGMKPPTPGIENVQPEDK